MKIVLAAIAGAAASAAVMYFGLLPYFRENYLAIGQANGEITARWEMATRLKREFPQTTSACAVRSTLFEVKTVSVYVVNCDGATSVLVKE